MAEDKEDPIAKIRKGAQQEEHARASENASWVAPPPNWNTWGHVPKVKLWEAVALSCNIDPECIYDSVDGFLLDLSSSTDQTDEFERRMKIAKACIGETLHPTPNPEEAFRIAKGDKSDDWPHEATVMVMLGELRRFALTVRWELPKAFPGSPVAADTPDVVREIDEKNLGKRERETLLKIIAALLYEHKYDLTQPWITAKDISNLTELRGARVAPETIRNHIEYMVSLLGKDPPP